MGTEMKFLNFIAAVIISIPLASFAQDTEKKPGEPLNLERAADDLKFENATGFIKLGLPDKALVELNEYLEIYMSGSHRHEALKIIGDIYFERFDYTRSIKAYSCLYEEFGSSDEGVFGLFKTGLCYQKMGYEKKALKVFRDILKNHPESSYAQQSQTQLDLINIYAKEQ